MYYRRKILLALIEACDGTVASTDFEKLLFLFCKNEDVNYYDFFPYKYGPFSLISYYDKRKLIEKGILKDVSGFELKNSSTYLEQLKKDDRHAILQFVEQTQNIRGRELVKKVYKEYPCYAIKSEIALEVLNEQEYEALQTNWKPTTEQTLFTIGYEGLSFDAYLYKLIFNDIAVLVDVRKNARSRKYGFSKTRMRNFLERSDIEYLHIPDLGIPSELRKELNGKDSYRKLFQHYETKILPEKSDSLETLKTVMKNRKRIALTCFEADHLMCHRNSLAKHLLDMPNMNIPLVHL